MSALGKWLRRWQPIAIHSAILAGARPEAVAGALGNTVEVAFDRWHDWAIRHRDFIIGGKPAMTGEEFDLVASKFANMDPNLGRGLAWCDRRTLPRLYRTAQTITKQKYWTVS